MRKLALYLFIVFALLILSFLFSINSLLTSILTNKLNAQLKNEIALSVSNTEVDVFKGTLLLDSLFLVQKDTITNTNKLQLSVTNVKVYGFGLMALLLNKTIKLDSLGLVNPNINFSAFVQDTMDRQSNPFKKVSVAKIKIENAAAVIETEQAQKFSFEALNAEMDDFSLPIAGKPLVSMLQYSKIDIHGSNISFNETKSLYKYTVCEIDVSTEKQALVFYDARIIPKYSKNKFGEILKREFARVKVVCPRIVLNNFNLHKLLSDNSLNLSKIVIDEYSIDVFKDKRYDRPKALPHKPLPHVLLHELSFPIKIDSVLCSSGNILFEGWPMGAKRSGSVEISKSRILIQNICNDTAHWKINGDVKIRFDGVINKQGQLQANFSLPVNNPEKPMLYSGSLSKMDLKKFNDVLLPFLNMRVKRGTLNHLDFDVAAYPHKATGKIRMNYQDLNVSVRKINNKTIENAQVTWALNLLVNSLFIKKDNPTRRKPLREGHIYFEPDPTRVFVHYWLNSIFSGIPESLGVPNKISDQVNK